MDLGRRNFWENPPIGNVERNPEFSILFIYRNLIHRSKKREKINFGLTNKAEELIYEKRSSEFD
jgi:hypothetical protein